MRIDKDVPPPEREFGFWAKIAAKMPVGASCPVDNLVDARSLCRAIRNQGDGKPTYKKQKKGYRVWKLEG